MQVNQLTNEQATLDASKKAIHQAVQYMIVIDTCSHAHKTAVHKVGDMVLSRGSQMNVGLS